eukprot:sb/3462430/
MLQLRLSNNTHWKFVNATKSEELLWRTPTYYETKCSFFPDMIWLATNMVDDNTFLIGQSPRKVDEKMKLLKELSFGNITMACNIITRSSKKVMGELECTETSMCATDECGCKTDEPRFFCPRGPGCIPFSQVCDGVSQCLDGLDECLCSKKVVELTCLNDGSYHTCLSKEHACSIKDSLQYLNCRGFDNATNCNLSLSIGQNATVGRVLVNSENRIKNVFLNYSGHPLGPIYEKTECLHILQEAYYWANISKWARDLCSRIFVTHQEIQNMKIPTKTFFMCRPSASMENIKQADVTLDKLCDGTTECDNSVDELYCPNRFYCSSKEDGDISWITESEVCDGVRDCANGRDECDGCKIGAVSSSKLMIWNTAFLWSTLVVGLAIVTLNLLIGFETYWETPESEKGKVNRIFRVQVAGYDLLMGVYLIMLVVVTVAFYTIDDYCQFDAKWRSSVLCAGLGCCFSISAHGSFMTITAMSLIRFLICLDYVDSFSVRGAWVTTGAIGILNVVHALIPVIPYWRIQEFFRTNMVLTGSRFNPFIQRFDGSHISKMHTLVYNSTPGDRGMETILEDLRNITSDPTLFDHLPIGYYGNSPLCVANVFKNQLSYMPYKMGYCGFVTMLMITLSVSYLSILVYSHRTSTEAGAQQKSVDNLKKLALKLSLLIGSQVIAWLSYTFTIFYFSWINPTAPSEIVQEVFTLVVLPSNSLLNPIFYSSIYRNLADILWKAWRQFVTRFGADN